MNRDEQLHVLRSEAHRLLDVLLDATSRYYGNKDAENKALQLEALANARTAMGAVVDAYGTTIGYPDAFPPHEALADEMSSQRRMDRDAVVSMLEDVATRISLQATDNHVAS